VAEQNRDGERSRQSWKDGSDGILGRSATLNLSRNEMADDLRVRFAFELAPFGDQFVSKRLEILNDAVVYERNRSDDMRMRIADGGRAMRRPARVRDARRTMEGALRELASKIIQLSLSAASLEMTVVDGADTC